MSEVEVRAAESSAAFAHAQAARRGLRIVDGADDLDAHRPEPADAASTAPVLVHLEYGAADGEVTERTVTILSAWEEGEVLYFHGRCHLRGALRTFRGDRIEELTCLNTGEVPDDPCAWILGHALLRAHGLVHATEAAMRRCADELAILAYLAGSDAWLDPRETEVAIDHVMNAGGAEIDRKMVAKRIARLVASPPDLERHVRAMAIRKEERWPALAASARRLVDADGVLDPREVAAWSEVQAKYDAAASSWAGTLGRFAPPGL